MLKQARRLKEYGWKVGKKRVLENTKERRKEENQESKKNQREKINSTSRRVYYFASIVSYVQNIESGEIQTELHLPAVGLASLSGNSSPFRAWRYHLVVNDTGPTDDEFV